MMGEGSPSGKTIPESLKTMSFTINITLKNQHEHEIWTSVFPSQISKDQYKVILKITMGSTINKVQLRGLVMRYINLFK